MADEDLAGAERKRQAEAEAWQAVDALVATLEAAGDSGIERLPVSLATTLALSLARSALPNARAAAERLFEHLRPLAGETIKQDDELANLALALGLAAEARALIEQRLTRSEALSAYQILARALVALGRSGDARALAERLMSEAGDRLTTWLLVGETLLAIGDQRGAERAYQQARSMAPGSSAVQLGLAQCLAAQGDGAGARELVGHVFAAYAGAPSLWVLREACVAAAALGDEAWKAELAIHWYARVTDDARAMQFGITTALATPSGLGTRLGEVLPSARARQAARQSTRAAVPDEELPVLSLEDLGEDFPPSEVIEALRDLFGYESFLPGQAAVLAAVMRGEDVLAIMPTGAGKSLCYQLPALLLTGVTVLVSPLIALMKDQLEGLPAAARSRTTILNSLLDPEEIERRLDEIAAGRYKLVYAAPERLCQQPFIYALRRAGVARFVVDEAHCVSVWGHDFRPDYL